MKAVKNNKGFTLVELIVAIAVLAIVVTPLLESFVTSAKMNKKSQEMMIQTDVIQSIMEGFADKTYGEIYDICTTKLGTASTGSNIFSTINNNAYNEANVVKYATSQFPQLNAKTEIGSMSSNTIAWTGYAPVSSNGVRYPESVSKQCYDAMLAEVSGQFDQAFRQMGDDKKMCYWSDPKGVVLFMGYANIESGGFKYDAIVSFIPGADAGGQIYYPYFVNIYLYKVDKTTGEHNPAIPVMTYTSGVRNIRQKGSL